MDFRFLSAFILRMSSKMGDASPLLDMTTICSTSLSRLNLSSAALILARLASISRLFFLSESRTN